MTIKRARVLRYLIAGLVVAALLAMALWPSAQVVDSARVDRGDVRETVEAEGRTRVRDRYVITAPIAANARRLLLEPGDTVKAGDRLIVLDAVATPSLDSRSRAEAQARASAARSRHAAAREASSAAEAAARQARAEASRLRVLASQQLVARETAERATTASQRADREAASARFLQATAAHEIEAAEAALAHSSRDPARDSELELSSPVDGVVLRRHFESARPVQVGDPLIEIGNADALEVEVDVLSSDAVRLRPGMSVELLGWGGPRPLSGRVRRIEPGGFTKISALGVEEQRVWVVVDITSEHREWSRLGEAYRLNARFVLDERRNVLRVPVSALFRHGAGHAVFRIEGQRAALAAVETGLQGSGFAEVRDGLGAGDIVIVHPDRELEDGDRVEAR